MTAPRRIPAATLCCLAAALAACAQTAAPAGDGGLSSEVFFGPSLDAAPKDAPAPDTAADAADAASAPPSDATGTADAAAKDLAVGAEPWVCKTPGTAGCACDAPADCDSGHCVETPNDGKVCSANCTDSCPPGWQCVAQGTTDIVYLCLPQWPVLCNPCDSDADCASAGVGKALCVDRGTLGHFCGAACAMDGDCPPNYACDPVKSVAGKQGKQCMPMPTKDGKAKECTCSKAAIAAALGTSCSAVAKSPEGAEIGVCGGVRQCTAQGLTACTAIAAKETCNGKDDDCDGQTDEAACDDNNACTTDTCDLAALQCAHSPTEGSCSADDNACTEGDACKDGKCAVGIAKKCDDGNPCTLDACAPAKGCTATLDDGAGCDDGDLCSVGDVCAAGQCLPGKPKLCAAGAACTVTACGKADGACTTQSQPDGTACDDGTACTDKDACAAGLCKGAAADCNDANPCTQDTCQPADGCKHQPNAAACDDLNACTDADTCGKGSCAGTPKAAKACDDNNPCTSDGCDPKAGCGNAPNTAACDDGNPCTSGDTCKAKACVPGASTCQCQGDADCKDDGNLCNGTMYCDKSKSAFECKVNPATVVSCQTSADGVCAQTLCDAKTGTCAKVAQADGKACDADGSLCTPGDACKAGVCAAGAKLNCNDGSPCTDDACDPKAGCTHAHNAAACDADGNGCTTPDTCKGGVCVAGPAKPCNDANACTSDSCDKATGACKNDGAALQGQACDADGSLCTGSDTCAAGICKAGPMLVCDDKNACTTDTCSPTKGCQHAALPDKTGCGTGQWCMAGAAGTQCVKAPNCGDKVVDAGEECDDGNQTDGDGCSGCKNDKPPWPAPGEVLITEIMPAPTNQQDEWVELFNASTKILSLQGVFFGDSNYYTAFDKTGGVFLINPGQYLLVAALKNPGGAGGPTPDYVYGYSTQGIALTNTGEYVCLSTNTQCTGTGVIAKVAYPKATAGKSYQLAAGKLDKASMDNSANWCLGKTPYGSLGDLGTPGKANTSCP
ncbi:MAG: lamin tail domain-containing protein [Deltaproteobacteria bacterium]|nr:lamin tail domain-containing protein [Deltaproteobacteria bacterium]